MFDIGMAEMVVIGVVALIVVGPKDLPVMFRRVGQFVGRARSMASDFQRAMEQAADDSGLKDVADTVKTATTMKNLGLDDAAKSLAKVNEDFEAKKIDAAAEHAKRQEAVKEANEAASKWPPEGVDVPDKADAAESAQAKEPAAKADAGGKKPAAKSATTKKPAAKKPAAKKPAAKAAAKKPAATKAGSGKAPKAAKTSDDKA